jgi:hypothetical protein
MASEPWKMPAWMKPCEPHFENTGGWTVEELYNCPIEETRSNVILGAMVVSVGSQITLLYRLHAHGLLVDPTTAATPAAPEGS